MLAPRSGKILTPLWFRSHESEVKQEAEKEVWLHGNSISTCSSIFKAFHPGKLRYEDVLGFVVSLSSNNLLIYQRRSHSLENITPVMLFGGSLLSLATAVSESRGPNRVVPPGKGRIRYWTWTAASHDRRLGRFARSRVSWSGLLFRGYLDPLVSFGASFLSRLGAYRFLPSV